MKYASLSAAPMNLYLATEDVFMRLDKAGSELYNTSDLNIHDFDVDIGRNKMFWINHETKQV